MITRAQVARRLGRSIATVRRLEGSVLHPSRDVDGVYRFDASEVDRVVAERAARPVPIRVEERLPDEAEAAQSAWFRERREDWGDEGFDESLGGLEPVEVEPRDRGEDTEVASREEELVQLRERLGEVERELSERKVSAEEKAQRAVLSDARERELMARDLMAQVEALSDRQLQRLGPETLALVASVLDEAGLE